eukprot:2894013-Pleurochrysis_carterae.AAC.2
MHKQVCASIHIGACPSSSGDEHAKANTGRELLGSAGHLRTINVRVCLPLRTRPSAAWQAASAASRPSTAPSRSSTRTSPTSSTPRARSAAGHASLQHAHAWTSRSLLLHTHPCNTGAFAASVPRAAREGPSRMAHAEVLAQAAWPL